MNIPQQLTEQQLNFVLTTIETVSGVVISPQQSVMVESRLHAYCKSEGETDLQQLLSRCSYDVVSRARMVGALTNGETSFFRDHPVFEALAQRVIPALTRHRAQTKRLRIWSAACSTGQEPYSLAMMLMDAAELAEWDVSILATDISPTRLEIAQAGIYTKAEVNRGLPAHRLLRHFSQEGDRFAIKENVKKMVSFRQLNLTEAGADFPMVDLILLRNAMLYWEPPVRAKLLNRIQETIERNGGGAIVLGAAESPYGLGAELQFQPSGGPGVYFVGDLKSPK